jgi:hypothetical protein
MSIIEHLLQQGFEQVEEKALKLLLNLVFGCFPFKVCFSISKILKKSE